MKIINLIGPQKLMKLMRFWPPYFTAGIRVKEVNDNLTYLKVSMVQRPWNTNYVGVHFGGSLYAMIDPFYMFMLLEHLQNDFIVWDKAASIEFLKPGKGEVHAEFKLTLEEIEDIRVKASSLKKYEPIFKVEIKDTKGVVVARATKTLYIRKKNPEQTV